MADVLSPSLFSSAYNPKPPYSPQSKLFEPAPPPDRSTVIQPHERPSTTSGISRLGFTKSGDGPDLTMNQPTLQRYRRHREYYIDGGDIVFLVSPPILFYDRKSSNFSPRPARKQVENVLFRVHRLVAPHRNHRVLRVSLKVWRSIVISSSASLLCFGSNSQGMPHESGPGVRMQTRASSMV